VHGGIAGRDYYRDVTEHAGVDNRCGIASR
jgi:hypothetical protein